MKTVTELLREADPLANEPMTSSEQRRYRREAILAAAHTPARAGAEARFRVTRGLALGFAMVVILFVAARIWSPFMSVYAAPVRFEVRLAEEKPGPGLQEARVSGTDRSVYLEREAIVTNSDISRAYIVQVDHSSRYNVSVEFNPAGAEKMRAATAKNIGKEVAILLDGRIVMTANVRSAIGKSAVISGDLSKVDAERIVEGITKIR